MAQKCPIYFNAAAMLRVDIDKGIYPVNSFLPPERDLCEKMGISRMTLRKAMDELVATGHVVRQRGKGVMVIDRFETVPESALPDSASSKCIVFILCSDNGRDRFSETYHASLFYIIERHCTKLGYHLIYKTANPGDKLETVLVGLNASFLILSSLMGPEILDQVKKSKIPSLLVNYRDERFISVQNDDISGASQMVQYLIDQGHRKIGVLSGPKGYLTSELRLTAWKDTMRTNGLNPDEMFISYGDWEFDSGLEASKKIAGLQPSDRPDAVFAFNDKSAAGLIRGLTSFGIKVPDDISVAGFDDMPICTEISPNLTTVRVNLNAIAFAIMQQIWYAENNIGSECYPYDIVVPCESIYRESVKKRS